MERLGTHDQFQFDPFWRKAVDKIGQKPGWHRDRANIFYFGPNPAGNPNFEIGGCQTQLVVACFKEDVR
jgi:hypothetical protein